MKFSVCTLNIFRKKAEEAEPLGSTVCLNPAPMVQR